MQKNCPGHPLAPRPATRTISPPIPSPLHYGEPHTHDRFPVGHLPSVMPPYPPCHSSSAESPPAPPIVRVPYTPAIVPLNTSSTPPAAMHAPLPPLHSPPTAYRQSRPLWPPPHSDRPDRSPVSHSRSPPALSGSPLSSPGHLSGPGTLCSHPPATGPGLPSCITSNPPPH